MIAPPSTMLLPGAPPARSQGPAPPGGPPGAPPGGEPFQSTLAEEWARTAPAEGHQSKGEEHHAGSSARHAAEEEPAPPSPLAQNAPTASLTEARTPAVTHVQAPHTGPAPDTGKSSPREGAKDAATATVSGKPNGSVPAADQRGAAVAAGAGAADPKDPASPARSVGESDLHASATEPRAVGITGKAKQDPQDPSARTSAESASSSAGRPRPVSVQAPAAATAAGASSGTREAPAKGRDDAAIAPSRAARPAAAAPSAASISGHHAADARAHTGVSSSSAPAAASSAAPSATEPQEPLSSAPASPSSPTAAAAAPSQGVPLQDMIDSIRGTIELSVRRGTSQARIALAPAELGDIRIHLSQTSQGLMARVTAGTVAAAQALAQGRPELQRALSSLGLSLLSLDIGLSGQGAAGQGSMQSGSRGTSGGSQASEDGGAEAISETEQGPEGPAKGELVDVLA